MSMDRYRNSSEWLIKAEHLIPTGSQTFSKSHYSLPKGACPLFMERGQGARVWDLDGHEYIDLVNGLLCVSLGYRHPEVDHAIEEQLSKGITFSLPHRLEAQLAERLVDLIPCAEQIRFGKNGTDATSAGVRVARAVTGRDRVAVCGYHGWQDWYIGSTSRNKGVPHAVRSLTHSFNFNDLNSLEILFKQHPEEFSLVVMEQMSVVEPEPGFLEGVRALCNRHNVVLMFDEIITGFRFHLGGAQSLFGVVPDLASFGKGLGNGMPISALVGKRSLMEEMENVFISGTFGGETLSLAASLAVVEVMVRERVPDQLAAIGERLTEGVMSAAHDTGASDWFSLAGHPTWKLWRIDRDGLMHKSVLIQLLAEQGVLTIGSHNLSASLTEADVDQLVNRYHQVFAKLQQVEDPGQLLRGECLKPVFKVR